MFIERFFMGSIRININSKAIPKQTSTTFTETLARFFLCAWSLKEEGAETALDARSWLLRDKSAKGYKTRDEVIKAFQSAINSMLAYYDELGEPDVKEGIKWNRDEIEYYILLNIANANIGKTVS